VSYKLKCWAITDIRTGRVTVVRAKNRRTLERRLGKRADEVLISECKAK
jgi:hypothetical protein